MSVTSLIYDNATQRIDDVQALAARARRAGCSAIVQPMGDDMTEIVLMGSFSAIESLREHMELPIYL